MSAAADRFPHSQGPTKKKIGKVAQVTRSKGPSGITGGDFFFFFCFSLFETTEICFRSSGKKHFIRGKNVTEGPHFKLLTGPFALNPVLPCFSHMVACGMLHELDSCSTHLAFFIARSYAHFCFRGHEFLPYRSIQKQFFKSGIIPGAEKSFNFESVSCS